MEYSEQVEFQNGVTRNRVRNMFGAEALHRELIAKRKEVEYRFRAFTADLPSTFGRKNTLKMYNK